MLSSNDVGNYRLGFCWSHPALTVLLDIKAFAKYTPEFALCGQLKVIAALPTHSLDDKEAARSKKSQKRTPTGRNKMNDQKRVESSTDEGETVRIQIALNYMQTRVGTSNAIKSCSVVVRSDDSMTTLSKV